MTIASAIQNAQEKVRNAYTAVSEKKGVLPTTQNLESLPGAIRSISGGDIVNTTAMSGAESFTGGEKVILNPAESTVAGPMTVTGGEIASGTAQPEGSVSAIQCLKGGAIVGDALYGLTYYNTTDYYPSYITYTGKIDGDSLSITKKTSTTVSTNPCSVSLPVFSKNGMGLSAYMSGGSFYKNFVKLNKDGTIQNIKSSLKRYGSNPDGTIILVSTSSSATAYFVEDDQTYTSTSIPVTTVQQGMPYYVLQTGEKNYAWGFFDGSGDPKILEFSKDGSYSLSSTNSSSLNALIPLDNSGTILSYSSDSQTVVRRFSTSTKQFTTIPEQGDALPKISYVALGRVAVLPITTERNVADIYIIPSEIPARIDHYVWDGSRVTNMGAILTSADLGEYVYPGNDMHLDGNTGILWGTFYKTNATSGAAGKIFALQTQGRTVITQFKAEPIDKAVFDPSNSLTGFVDSNLGVDEAGNIELSVKTALDPKEEP